jgi:hypothetical protein
MALLAKSVMALLAKDDLHDQPWKIVDGGHQEKADLVQLVCDGSKETLGLDA